MMSLLTFWAPYRLSESIVFGYAGSMKDNDHEKRYFKPNKCIWGTVTIAALTCSAVMVLKPRRIILFSYFSRYYLKPEKVVSITENETGIEIATADPDLPATISFSSSRYKPSSIIQFIQKREFIPSACSWRKTEIEGSPIRKSVSFFAVLAWNLWLLAIIYPSIIRFLNAPSLEDWLQIFDLWEELEAMISLLSFSFLMGLFLYFSPSLQKMIAKPGRNFQELSAATGFWLTVHFIMLSVLITKMFDFEKLATLLFGFGFIFAIFVNRLHARISEGV